VRSSFFLQVDAADRGGWGVEEYSRRVGRNEQGRRTRLTGMIFVGVSLPSLGSERCRTKYSRRSKSSSEGTSFHQACETA